MNSSWATPAASKILVRTWGPRIMQEATKGRNEEAWRRRCVLVAHPASARTYSAEPNRVAWSQRARPTGWWSLGICEALFSGPAGGDSRFPGAELAGRSARRAHLIPAESILIWGFTVPPTDPHPSPAWPWPVQTLARDALGSRVLSFHGEHTLIAAFPARWPWWRWAVLRIHKQISNGEHPILFEIVIIGTRQYFFFTRGLLKVHLLWVGLWNI